MAQQTKNAIRRAFIQLLNERPLDKISIKDIAEKGAVNRNTFCGYLRTGRGHSSAGNSGFPVQAAPV